MARQIGKQSLTFREAPFIMESASIGGTREAEGPLGEKLDATGEEMCIRDRPCPDYRFQNIPASS